MRSFTDKIALQHLVNAYLQETGNGRFIPIAEQSQQLQNQSQGNTVLCIPLQTVSGFLYAPLAYVSKVGRHRFAALPWVEQGGKILKLSPVNLAANLLENLIFQKNDEALDSSSLLECWIQSRGALQQFLSYREEQIDAVIKAQQNFIQSEQALVLGHSMHPSPKSRQGFVQNDWQLYSPETQSTFKMHFLYIHPDQVVHDNAHKIDISN